MDEIEVKILEVGHEDLKSKLLLLGAKKVFEGELDAIFLDTEDSKIKNSNENFRLRKQGKKTFLTYKQKIPSDFAKIRKETEIEVSDFEITKELLRILGFKEVDSLKKIRISYELNGAKIEFDKFSEKYDFVPEFLEIEAKNIDELNKCIELLGFSKKDCKPWSRKNVIKYYS